MSDEADRLLRRIEALESAAADNRRRAEAFEQTVEEMKTVTATVTSPDGMVTVVSDSGGDVRQLKFGDRVSELDPATLSQTVTQTVAAAKAAAARLQAEAVRRGLGPSDVLDKVLAEEPPASPAPEPGPGRHRREPAQEDRFFENFNVFDSGKRR